MLIQKLGEGKPERVEKKGKGRGREEKKKKKRGWKHRKEGGKRERVREIA